MQPGRLGCKCVINFRKFQNQFPISSNLLTSPFPCNGHTISALCDRSAQRCFCRQWLVLAYYSSDLHTLYDTHKGGIHNSGRPPCDHTACVCVCPRLRGPPGDQKFIYARVLCSRGVVEMKDSKYAPQCSVVYKRPNDEPQPTHARVKFR